MGKEATSPSTPTSARVCTVCGEGKYSNANTKYICTAWSICDVGKYITRNATRSVDRDCGLCNLGTHYSDAWNLNSCKKLSVCRLSLTYSQGALSVSQDRQCTLVSPCTEGSTFQVQAPTLTSNTVCRAVKMCGPGQYQSRAPTPLQDRECSPVHECEVGVTYETMSPSTSEDRQCRNVTVCGSGQTETQEPTYSTGWSLRLCVRLRLL